MSPSAATGDPSSEPPGPAPIHSVWRRAADAVARWPRLASLALFALLAIAHTWPLASRPAYYSRADNGDYLLNAWALDWVARSVPTTPAKLFDANIFHPAKHTLAYSEPLILQGLLVTPAVRLGAPAVLTMNLAILAGLALSGWAFAWYGQAITGRWWPGLIAGSMVAFNAHNLMRLAHVQALHLETVPLVFVGLHLIATRGRPRDSLLTGLALASQALISLYQLVFVGWALACAAAARLFDAARPWRTAALCGLSVIVAAAVAWPVLGQYATLAFESGMRREAAEAARYAGTWRDYLYTGSRVHHGLWSHAFRASDASFPGIVGAALAVAGLLTSAGDRRVVRMWGAVLAGSILLSVAPHLPGFAVLHRWLPPFQVIRAFSRAGQIALVAVAVLAAFGTLALLERAPRRAGAIGVLLLALVNVEALRAPLWWAPYPGTPAIYTVLRDVPRAVVVELPLFDRRSFFGNARYMVYATVHRKPIVNGYSGFAPRGYDETRKALGGFPDLTALSHLHGLGVTHVVVHQRWFNAARMAAIDRSPALSRVASDGAIAIYEIR